MADEPRKNTASVTAQSSSAVPMTDDTSTAASRPNTTTPTRQSRTIISNVGLQPKSGTVESTSSSILSIQSLNSSIPPPSIQSIGTSTSTLPKRRTVGNRLGPVLTADSPRTTKEEAIETTDRQKQQQHEREQLVRDVVPQLEQLTQLLKNSNLGPPSMAHRPTAPRDLAATREVQFQPPWESTVGQLQSVCAAIHRYSTSYLQNKECAIVRCYPHRNPSYMHMVYNLIYGVVSNEFLGPPAEIRPILLNYAQGAPLPPPLPAQNFPQNIAQWPLTDQMLLRIRFDSAESSFRFQEAFNRMARQVFGQNLQPYQLPSRAHSPFAHPDQTLPERKLRQYLQGICRERNGMAPNMIPFGGTFGMAHTRRRRQSSQQQHPQNRDFYFHNGIQLFKRSSHGRVETVEVQSFTEISHLHTVVTTLRKYANLYKQKESSVIVQGLELAGPMVGADEDSEHITGAVYRVVLTDEFRQRVPGGTVPLEVTRVERRNATAPHNNQVQLRSQAPPLVRVRFRTREAARAFIALFRDCHEREQQRERNEEAESDAASLAEPNRSTQSVGKKAFAHRDLTPPELALHYAMRRYCLDRNRTERERSLADSSGRHYFYVRQSKIFERTADH